MPVGAIVWWPSSAGAIPAGWALCDGTANAPGPDLRGRFLVGADGAHADGSTGGSLTHTHAGHSNHIVTQPVDHFELLAHDHSHSHSTNRFPTATGGSTGHTVDTSMSGTQVVTNEGTSIDATSTGDAQVTHSGTAVNAHSAHDIPNHEPTWYAAIWIQRMS